MFGIFAVGEVDEDQNWVAGWMLWTRCVHSCIIVIIIVGGRLDFDYDNDDDDDNDWAGPGCCVVKSLIV